MHADTCGPVSLHTAAPHQPLSPLPCQTLTYFRPQPAFPQTSPTGQPLSGPQGYQALVTTLLHCWLKETYIPTTVKLYPLPCFFISFEETKTIFKRNWSTSDNTIIISSKFFVVISITGVCILSKDHLFRGHICSHKKTPQFALVLSHPSCGNLTMEWFEWNYRLLFEQILAPGKMDIVNILRFWFEY